MIARHVETSGLTFDFATNGLEAVEAVVSKKYRIILMDIQVDLPLRLS